MDIMSKEIKKEKIKVYLLKYTEDLALSEVNEVWKKKIFFNRSKLEDFIKNNLIFKASVQPIEVEDVEWVEYKLI